MFEKMRKSRKAWAEFCKWMDKKHNIEYINIWKAFYFRWLSKCKIKYVKKENIFILLIIPFFFDKNDSDIEIRPDEFNCRVRVNVVDKPKTDLTFIGEDREAPLIKACEKAFEIYEKELKK